MNHRHLLPDEIDQLVDDELGFGTAPLKAHLAECRDCQVRLDEARAVAGLIEQLPRLAPSHRFTDRVMAQVPVFVPWHVAARDEIAKWVPSAGRSHRVAMVAGGGVAAVLGVITVALATQSDLILLGANIAVDKTRELIVAGVGGIVVDLFGEQTFNAVARFGALGFTIAALAMVGALGGAYAGLRALAASASRRRG